MWAHAPRESNPTDDRKFDFLVHRNAHECHRVNMAVGIIIGLSSSFFIDLDF